MPLREALFYSREGDDVRCSLCPQQCLIHEGRRGKCGVRQNIEGTLYSLVYGELVAEHVDPIEKKPLFHVLPGSLSLSISTVGCNFRCQHCQNSTISQVRGFPVADLRGRQTTPEHVVENASRNGCRTISYTYVEPTIYFEFAYDCAVLAKRNDICNVFVSNGYIGDEAARKIAPCLDAINIDVKAFTDEFYKKVCGARLQPVLDTVKRMKDLGVWVEVTTLVIPGMNDSDEELEQIASFLVSVDPGLPWHVSGFYPTYKMTDRPATPLATLSRARKIGLKSGLQFVYEGNVPGSGGEHSVCPSCQHTVIERHGFSVRHNRLDNGRCPDCSAELPGIW